MPTLRLVPDPTEDPDALALAAGDPHLAPAPVDSVPIRWFGCADLGVGAAVRTHVLTVLNAWAVDTDTIADAMVLVSELVTNVRDHSPSDVLGVRVSMTPGRVVVAVVEESPSGPPPGGRLEPGPRDATAPGTTPTDRGRGLRILDSVASEWGFVRRAGISTVWFALPATPPPTTAREPEIHRF